MKFDIFRITVRKPSRLPHWDVQYAIYFVTFNLFDAVPHAMRSRIHEEARAHIDRIQHLRGELTIAEKRAIDEWIRRKTNQTLDECYGRCFMRDPRVAKIVADAITFFDEQRYRLIAWCVMPNHVHVVFTLFDGHRLDGVIHSWKSFTAKKANAVLGRQGELWQDGYFDRTIRDSRELAAVVGYVAGNPGKAGLGEWEFVRVYPERVPPAGMAGGGERDARPPLAEAKY